MIDLVDVLVKAQKYSSWSIERLSMLIKQNSFFSFDWDRKCGERWASIELDGKFMGYISSFIPLCFCKVHAFKDIEKFFGNEVFIVSEDNFDKKNWFIDEKRIITNFKELSWIVQEGMLDFQKFSINDFWYSTI